MVRKSTLAFALAVTFCAGTATAATCHYTSVWRPQHDSSERNLINRTIELEHNVSREGATTLEMLLGALKVVDQQKSGEESRKQEAIRKSDEAYVNVVNQYDRNTRIVEIKEQFSYETGQGANACATVGFQQKVLAAIDGVKSAGSGIYQAVDIAPGSVPTPEQQARDRADPSSTDAKIIFAKGSDADKVKFIQHLAGFAVPKPEPKDAGSVAGEFQMIKARRAEAWRSPALISISTVAGMNGQSTTGDSAGSVTEAMDALIDNYGGGPAYQKWTNALQMQSERGLTVELNRLRAVSMRLRTVLSESLARQAAVSASLLAAEATGTE